MHRAQAQGTVFSPRLLSSRIAASRAFYLEIDYSYRDTSPETAWYEGLPGDGDGELHRRNTLFYLKITASFVFPDCTSALFEAQLVYAEFHDRDKRDGYVYYDPIPAEVIVSDKSVKILFFGEDADPRWNTPRWDTPGEENVIPMQIDLPRGMCGEIFCTDKNFRVIRPKLEDVWMGTSRDPRDAELVGVYE